MDLRFRIQGIVISLLIIYTFFSKEVETPRCFCKTIRGYESGFLVKLLITTI